MSRMNAEKHGSSTTLVLPWWKAAWCSRRQPMQNYQCMSLCWPCVCIHICEICCFCLCVSLHIVLLLVNVSYRFVDWLLAGQVSVRFDLVLFRVVNCTSIHEGVWFGCSVKKAKENTPAIWYSFIHTSLRTIVIAAPIPRYQTLPRSRKHGKTSSLSVECARGDII